MRDQSSAGAETAHCAYRVAGVGPADGLGVAAPSPGRGLVVGRQAKRLMSSVFVGGALVFLAASATHADPLDDAFKAPGAEARPWARWWWPGGAVTPAGLHASLEMLDRSGFGGGEIQPFTLGVRQTDENRAQVNDYATPSFFEKVHTAADDAQARGLGLDYTFGSGWPSGGGAAITPELALVELTMAATTIEGGVSGPVLVAVPKRTRKIGGFIASDPRTQDPEFADWSERIDARQTIVAVIAVRGEAPVLLPKARGGFVLSPFRDVSAPGAIEAGSALVLTDRMSPTGALDWTPPPGRWQVLVFKQYVVDSGISGGAGRTPQLVLDHFRREAFDAHAGRVGNPLVAALNGADTGVRGVFIDSIELMPDLPWTPDFLEEFQRRRGYDLTPYLPLILQPGWMDPWNLHYSPPYYEMGDVGERVRFDYRQTLSDLQIENFFQPFADWARGRGLTSRLQAHGGFSDLIRSYGVADMPETEDLPGGADPHFLRIARSAADLYARPLVSAESFAMADRPYDVTPGLLRQRADALLSSGVNHIVEHGAPYPFATETWPGWFPFAPTNYAGHGTMIAETNPVLPGMVRVNAYIRRMQAVLRQGRNVVPVALYFGEIGHSDGPAGTEDAATEPGRLLDSGYDYDRINDDLLGRSQVRRGRLVTPHGMAFEALVIPAGAPLRAETAEKVAGFARDGLRVVFSQAAPDHDPGLKDHEARDRRVREASERALRAGAVVAAVQDVPAALERLGAPFNLRIGGGKLQFIQRRTADRALYFLQNREQVAQAVTLDLPPSGRVERWDGWSGRQDVLASRRAGGLTRVELTLSPGESALLVVGGRARPPSAIPVVRSQTPLASSWSLTAQGRGRDGRVVATEASLDALRDWREVEGLADLSGQGVYRTRFDLPTAAVAGSRWIIDLGQVHDMASLVVNGRSYPVEVGPYRFDVTEAVKATGNSLEVTVSNSPNNALVGPAMRSLQPTAAGLIGPIRLIEQDGER